MIYLLDAFVVLIKQLPASLSASLSLQLSFYKGFCRVRMLKLKALFKALNQSAVTLRCVTVGRGYSEFDTWRGKEGRREGQKERNKGAWRATAGGTRESLRGADRSRDRKGWREG